LRVVGAAGGNSALATLAADLVSPIHRCAGSRPAPLVRLPARATASVGRCADPAPPAAAGQLRVGDGQPSHSVSGGSGAEVREETARRKAPARLADDAGVKRSAHAAAAIAEAAAAGSRQSAGVAAWSASPQEGAALRRGDERKA
jgi:hypothetical protein